MSLVFELLGVVLILVVLAIVLFIINDSMSKITFLALVIGILTGLILYIGGVVLSVKTNQATVSSKTEIGIIQIYDTQGNLIEEYEVQH